jgi:hypothetical protein
MAVAREDLVIDLFADLFVALGVTPDGRRLLGEVARMVSPKIMRMIAAADYGHRAEEHAARIREIVETGVVPDPLEWYPGEVLELVRWSEPEDPSWRPGAEGRNGHIARAFSCAALLSAAGAAGDGDTIVQLVASVLALGPALAPAAAGFFAARLLDARLGVEERPFFIFGLLVLLRLGGLQAPTPAQWSALATWLDDAEVEARLASRAPDVGFWLLDLADLQKRATLEALGIRAFAPGPAGAELIADKIATWPR